MTTSLCNANDPAGWTSPRIASSLAKLMSSFSEVISARVNHDRTSQDTFRADELEQAVGLAAFSIALRVCLEITKISYVTFLIVRCAMRFAERVDCVRDVNEV